MVKNMRSCGYVLSEVSEQTFVELMKLIGIQNVYAAIYSAENDSELCQEMQASNGKYGLYRIEVSDEYTDFFWFDCLSGCNKSTFKKVIESNSELISFRFSDQPVITSKDIATTFANSKCMEEFLWKYAWPCVFEITLHDDCLSIIFDSKRFLPKEFTAKIESVVFREKKRRKKRRLPWRR